MQRAVKTMSPFEFRADFATAAPAQAGPDTLMIGAQELAALLAQARAEGVAEAARDAGLADLARLNGLGRELSHMLGDLVALAGHIEAAQYDAATESRARALIDAMARRILDGQGELFAVSASQAARLDTGPPDGPRGSE